MTQTERDNALKVAVKRAGYYRANPHRFAKDFLLLDLKLFQKILLFMMFKMDYFMYLASRGYMASPYRNIWEIRAQNRRTL